MTTAQIRIKYREYPKYKPSGIDWLGDIPERWEVKRLKHGFFYTKGKNAATYTAEYMGENSGKYPVYSGQTESEGVMGFLNTYDYDFEKVIFTTTVGAKVMTPMLLSGKFSLSQNCLLMIKSSKQVFEKYFYYQLFPLFYREKSLVPSHMQPSLRFSDLNTFMVAYPKFEEQREIVAFLDRETAKIDEVITKKQKLIELLLEKRQALISHAVTKGLDPKTKMKPSGIDWLGDIPVGWEVKRAKYLGRAIIGLTYSPDEVVNKDEGVLILRSSNIQNGLIELIDNVYVKTDIPEDLITKIGDILICSRNGSVQLIGKNILINESAANLSFGAFMTIFRSKYYEFLYYFFNSSLFTSQTGLFSTSTINQLTTSILNNMEIPMPPSDTQQEIVKFLKNETVKINEVMKKVETQIEKLQEFRQALISNAVTGKVKV